MLSLRLQTMAASTAAALRDVSLSRLAYWASASICSKCPPHFTMTSRSPVSCHHHSVVNTLPMHALLEAPPPPHAPPPHTHTHTHRTHTEKLHDSHFGDHARLVDGVHTLNAGPKGLSRLRSVAEVKLLLPAVRHKVLYAGVLLDAPQQSYRGRGGSSSQHEPGK